MSDDTASVPADVSTGDKIAGYRLEEQIGQGGMAVVYRAHDERLDRRVALKLLSPALAADGAFRTRFIRESRAAAAVDHPNIIPVYDAGDAGGVLFISMRYVQGGDVRSLVKDGGPLAPAQAWSIISQVADALDAAHEHGLVHRDVKPANMLLDASSRTSGPRRADGSAELPEHVYLSDFGISKRTVASNLTSTGQFVGTLDYIAPEQIEGHPIDGRTDEYSLACTAFELLSGVPPFRRAAGLALINAHLTEPPPSLVARRSDLAGSIDVVLAKAMAKSPAQRYPTCMAFAMDLGRSLGLVPGPLEAGATPPAGLTPQGGLAKGGPATELAQPPTNPPPTGLPAAAGREVAATTPPDQWPAAGPGQPAGPGSPGLPGQPTMLAETSGPSGPQGTPAPTRAEWPTPGGQGGQGGPGWPGSQGGPGTAGGQGGQGWPGTTGEQAGPAQRPRRSRGLIAGAVVATLAVAAAAVAVTIAVIDARNNGTGQPGNSSGSSPASSSPATTTVAPAQAQATAMGNLLSTSKATRGQLGPAVYDIENNCATLSPAQLSTDVSTIRTVAMQRQSEYSQAQALQTDALPNGAEMKTDLLNALQYSMDADNDYLQWAQQEQSACTPTADSSAHSAALTASSQASTAKTAFANLWNSIAASYGQQTVSEGDI